ncbi:MAG: DUF2207 domain-containing protein [Gemmatimonadetes bacterium]|nr:DUF2207 domain-containing protein [Gemmatimonadota bacterium]
MGTLRRRGVAAGLVVAALAIAGLPTALVAQRSVIMEELSSEIRVRSDGDIVVTETLRARFSGTWNGIERWLELRPPSDYGQSHLLRAVIVGATDEAGGSLRIEEHRVDADSRRIQVWVPNATDRVATVVLTYRIGDALGFFEPDSATGLTMDELYWQVTGTDWDVPILNASARVFLPGGAQPVQAAGYVGGASSARQVPVRFEEGAVSVSAGERLDPGEGLTVAVGWPAGAVTRPGSALGVARAQSGGGGVVGPGAGRPTSVLESIRATSPRALWPLLLPFAVFWVAYRAWARRGRDPSERAIAVQWEPPADLTPAEVGTLVDHDAGMRDIIPTLVDLAVRGVVVIEEREKGGLLSFGKDYAFHLAKPSREWSALSDHEVAFLNGLFDPVTRREALGAVARRSGALGALADTLTGAPASQGAPPGAVDSVLLSELKNEFYKSVPGIKSAVYQSLVLKGYYLRRPDRVRNRWLAFAFMALVVAFGGTPILVAEATGGAPTAIAMGVAAGLSAMILGIFAFLMPARTEKGARARESALGFKRFLERVESPRYRRMIRSPEQFEQYLPFAMAFGCEETWARAFDGLITEPPDWYRGRHGAFRPTAFASDLGTLSTTARSTLSSSPSSSGSGGGGSVGGGGGGGGGGGF